MHHQMPPSPNEPHSGQPFPLSKDRQVSSIPKWMGEQPSGEGGGGGAKESENWVYPSEQMFWNAMRRKVSSFLDASSVHS